MFSDGQIRAIDKCDNITYTRSLLCRWCHPKAAANIDTRSIFLKSVYEVFERSGQFYRGQRARYVRHVIATYIVVLRRNIRIQEKPGIFKATSGKYEPVCSYIEMIPGECRCSDCLDIISTFV
jgi:hypothetical protein